MIRKQKNWKWGGVAGALTLLLVCAATGAQQKMADRHRQWLERDVVYIITDEEKNIFKKLPTEEDRDKFMQQFWVLRDPTPGTPQNEYKDEHYKRMDFANQFFASDWVSEGWRSDRGKIYIILGAPGSRQFFTSGGQIYPIELWFYSANEPSLPPFFYVLFYKKFDTGDFRLYSPYIDGPEKLVRASGAENEPRNAYRFLRDFNMELARASLTLIPGEPADINQGTSLSSDGMLMKVLNLANDKFRKQKLGLQRRLQEEVSSRVIYNVHALRVATLPLQSANGEYFLNYTLQINAPEQFALGQHDDKAYLAAEIQVKLLGTKKETIYELSREVSQYFTATELEDLKKRPLALDDRIPIAPGNYEAEFLLYNKVSRLYYRTSATVRVEATPSTTLKIGKPVLVQRCEAASNPEEPFAFSGTKCTIQARVEAEARGRPHLSILVPVYLGLTPVGGDAAGPVKVTYTVGRLGAGAQGKKIEETLDRRRADKMGTILVGKSIPIEGLGPGNFLLALQVSDTGSRQSVGATMPFSVVEGTTAPLFTITIQPPEAEEQNGENEFRRGLASRAQNDPPQAAAQFTQALARNPNHAGAKRALASILYAQGDYQNVMALIGKEGVTKSSDPETIRILIASLGKTGQINQAIVLAEQALALLDPGPEFYVEVAGIYDQAGRQVDAEKVREKARRLEGLRKLRSSN